MPTVPQSAVDDRDLVARVRAGDPVAERELYDRHVDRVYRLCFRLAGDAELARDFTQDAFVRAFDKLDTFRGDAAFSTWLYRLTVTTALNGLRKIKRFRQHEVALADGATVAAGGREAEPDLKIKLARAIDALPLGYRTVFLMHDVEGYTHEEIAGALDVQVGTSKAQLSRARARLRERLAEFAGEWQR